MMGLCGESEVQIFRWRGWVVGGGGWKFGIRDVSSDVGDGMFNEMG